MRIATTLQQAQRLRALGLSIFAVPRPRSGVPAGEPGDGKVPARPWKPYQSRFATDEEITTWFAGAPMNIAIATGQISGIVVIDADSEAACHWCTQTLPYTPWQTIPSKGAHFFYRCPEGRVANRARVETRDGRLAIDVRGDGGFVIAPGSVHASGVEYCGAGDWTVPRAQLPIFDRAWLQRPARSSETARRQGGPSTLPTGYLIERARRYLAAVPRPEIGAGSDAATLFAACRLVRGFGLPTADAEALLWDWCGGRAGWTRDWVARKVQHAERYGSEPIGAMR